MDRKIVQKPTIFISYSHKDEDEKEQLFAHLSVLQHAGLTQVWSDDQIEAGHDWQEEIQEIISQARVAILLVSANFLTSEFILGQEVPTLLHRRQIEGLVVVPVIAKACAWRKVDWLAQLQVRPRDGRPVWREGGRYADEHLADIAEQVADFLEFSSPLSELLPQYPFTLPKRNPSLKNFRQWLQGHDHEQDSLRR